MRIAQGMLTRNSCRQFPILNTFSIKEANKTGQTVAGLSPPGLMVSMHVFPLTVTRDEIPSRPVMYTCLVQLFLVTIHYITHFILRIYTCMRLPFYKKEVLART